VTPSIAEKTEADLVESLVDGLLAEQDAKSIAEFRPGLREVIVSWIRGAVYVGNWSRVEKFANLAVPLRVAGLTEVLQEILDLGATGLNKEDLVDILGEIREPSAVFSLFRVAEDSMSQDAPPILAMSESCFLSGGNWHARGP